MKYIEIKVKKELPNFPYMQCISEFDEPKNVEIIIEKNNFISASIKKLGTKYTYFVDTEQITYQTTQKCYEEVKEYLLSKEV